MFLIKERVCKLIEDIQGLIYSDRRPVTEYRMKHTDGRSADPASEDTSCWETLTSNEIWGGHREYFYFAAEIVIPEEWAGKSVVYELRTGREGEWDALNPQFLAYVNGKARAGLDVNHRQIQLSDSAEGGEVFRLLLAAFTGDNNFSLKMDSEIRVLEPEIEKYYYDLTTPYEAASLMPEESEERCVILQCLNESLNLVDFRKVYSPDFYESLKQAEQYLDENLYGKHCSDMTPTVYCVGHTHIDLAWLWTLRVTRDKAVRSFTTVTELMRRYPEYIFTSSQPQLYKYVKEQAPELYEEIRELVREGRWEPEGGMFVEADCNLASGESLVRQFVYGMRFFEREFGKKCRILWLPDVFGYSAALPQIMKLCGIRYFMTTKISWNERNKMPVDTFLWEGIDGSEILTHFIPTRNYGAAAVEGTAETEHFTTYNGYLNPSQVMGGWHRYSQKDLNREILMSYGYGDGGGGTTKEMLEYQRRLSRGIPGCPKTVPSTSLAFFETLDRNVRGKKELKKWVGELYLEYHRGTYTSMARNKKFNRKAEFACQNLEFFGVLSGQLTGQPYQKETLDRAWEIILRNQFHDILPGSAIKEVYEDSREEYLQLFREVGEETGKSLDALTEAISGEAGTVVIYNPNSVKGGAPVVLPVEEKLEHAVLTDGEKTYPIQQTEEETIAVVDDIPSKGYRSFRIVEGGAETSVLSVTERGAETPFFIVELNEKGQFCRIYDKIAGREILPEGTVGNRIVSYEDRPHNFDNWDINHYYKEKAWEVDHVSSIAVTENGPVRSCIRVERDYLDSKIVQKILFYRDLYQIDIVNEIDWKQDHILLRSYLPADIHADEAAYEIQYGNVKRPTHFNTSWDAAKFEVCAHKWIDLSEDGYGVSVLNDCKFGCDIHHGVIGLTMLKSGTYPNPEADKEHHSFTWSICPHEGTWREGGTVAKAYLLNDPYKAAVKKTEGGGLPASCSFITSDAENVVIEVVKKAEDSDAVAVRMYECFNRRTDVTLTFLKEIREADFCNLLEEKEGAAPVSGQKVSFTIKPYEIKTLLVRF